MSNNPKEKNKYLEWCTNTKSHKEYKFYLKNILILVFLRIIHCKSKKNNQK